MAIKKDVKMIIKGDQATSNSIYIYKNDAGIELHIAIEDKQFLFDSKKSNVIRRFMAGEVEYEMFSQITIVKPDNASYMTHKLPIIEDKVVFKITKDITDEIDEIGSYTMQIHLFDAYDNRVTMPPIQFEVKELIAEPLPPSTDGPVGDAMADIFKVSPEGNVFAVELNNYPATIWQTGDLISSIKLNKMETGIVGATLRVGVLENENSNNQSRIQELENIKNLESVVTYTKVTYTSSEGV